jgi:hypothetical protein
VDREKEATMTCIQSKNVLCKHVRATRTYYVDLDDYLPDDVTLVSVTADTSDNDLNVDDVQIVEADLVIEANANCDEITLRADRAILVVLSGGEEDEETMTDEDEETIVTVNWVQSDGDEDSVDCRLIVAGRLAP